MRFLAIADTHLGYIAGKTAKAREFISEHMFKAFEKIVEIAKKDQFDYILHGGDIFNRSKPPKKVIDRTYQIIEEILNEDIGFIIVPGNHERSRLPNTLLSFHPKSKFLSKLTTIEIDDWLLVGFPFEYKTNQEFTLKLNKICRKNDDKKIIILCHQLFDGAIFGPRKFQFGLHHGAIDPLILHKNVKLVVTGHIHRAQSLVNGLVVYPGSLERTSFIEKIEPKGYLDIELTTDTLSVDFKELETLPMQVLEIDLSNEDFNLELLTEFVSKGYCRTLLRFTGRALLTDEFESLRTTFPDKLYPLLSISPKFPKQELKSLYNLPQKQFQFKPIRKSFS